MLERLLAIWKRKGAKVLLFTQSTQMLDILADFVARQGYSYERLDGQTSRPNRAKVVDRFNNNESVFLFLLSTKAGGLGINLVAATVVIIFDPTWNPSHDMQAQDRAYRIGQRKDVKARAPRRARRAAPAAPAGPAPPHPLPPLPPARRPLLTPPS